MKHLHHKRKNEQVFTTRKKKHDRYNFITKYIDLNMIELPDDLLNCIFSYLDPRSLANCHNVCRTWQRLIDREQFWKHVFVNENRNITIDQSWSMAEDLNFRQKYYIRQACLERAKEALLDYVNNTLFNEEISDEGTAKFRNFIGWKDLSKEMRIQLHHSITREIQQFEKQKLTEYWEENRVSYSGKIIGIEVEITVEKGGSVKINFGNEFGNKSWEETKDDDGSALSLSFVDRSFKKLYVSD